MLSGATLTEAAPVSYTHLDVYKRQVEHRREYPKSAVHVRFVLLPIRKITDCVHLLLLRQMMREF